MFLPRKLLLSFSRHSKTLRSAGRLAIHSIPIITASALRERLFTHTSKMYQELDTGLSELKELFQLSCA